LTGEDRLQSVSTRPGDIVAISPDAYSLADDRIARPHQPDALNGDQTEVAVRIEVAGMQCSIIKSAFLIPHSVFCISPPDRFRPLEGPKWIKVGMIAQSGQVDAGRDQFESQAAARLNLDLPPINNNGYPAHLTLDT